MRTNASKIGLRLVALVGIVSVVVLVAACGGGSGDGGSRLSSEEFVAEGNAICAEANEQIEALGEFPASPEEAVDYLGEFADILEQEAESFAALDPPEDVEETLNQGLAILEDVSELAREASDAAAEGDIAGLQDAAGQVSSLEQELDDLTASAGLTECN